MQPDLHSRFASERLKDDHAGLQPKDDGTATLEPESITIRPLQRGYAQAQKDPESAVTALVEADSGLDREAAQAQVDAVAPAWTAGASRYGELREDVLREWAAWDVEFGILEKEPDVARAFDLTLVP